MSRRYSFSSDVAAVEDVGRKESSKMLNRKAGAADLRKEYLDGETSHLLAIFDEHILLLDEYKTKAENKLTSFRVHFIKLDKSDNLAFNAADAIHDFVKRMEDLITDFKSLTRKTGRRSPGIATLRSTFHSDGERVKQILKDGGASMTNDMLHARGETIDGDDAELVKDRFQRAGEGDGCEKVLKGIKKGVRRMVEGMML